MVLNRDDEDPASSASKAAPSSWRTIVPTTVLVGAAIALVVVFATDRPLDGWFFTASALLLAAAFDLVTMRRGRS